MRYTADALQYILEKVLKRALENEVCGIVVNGTPVNNIRYADDTVILAHSIEYLQRLTCLLIAWSKRTKLMVISKNNPMCVSLSINKK